MSKFYLTTSIAYVNAPPHLGYALELVQADAVARWRRQKGDDVFFLTGTDEHGAKIARAAEAAGKTPRELVDENAEKFRALKNLLNLSWDDFIRTSDEARHFPNVQMMWKKLEAAGDIYKKFYQGLYCVGHEAFVTEKDLVNGKCRDHGTAPEVIKEENYFFRLSKYADEVKKKIQSGDFKIIPEGRAKEINNFIDQGIEDISFSRPRKDLPWGVPVPGDDTQTVYVWCDALVNYLLPHGRWPADVHMVGKDILRFHALYWPAMLMSAGMPLPRRLFVHGHITVQGQKMSKTLGNVVDPVALIAQYGADAVRYYLLREIPPTDDGDFSEEKFKDRYAADLVNGLGNFAARIRALKEKQGVLYGTPSSIIAEKIRIAEKTVDEKMAQYAFNEALAALGDLVRYGDQYLNEQKPWSKEQIAQGKSHSAIKNALAILEAVADLVAPFMPYTAQAIKKKKPGILFPRV